MAIQKTVAGASEKRFSGAALERALAEQKFESPSTPLIGMVKASEKAGHIGFAPAGCDSFVDVPSALLEEAEHIGHQTCKDHSHPVFRLTLKEPQDPQAKLLMALLLSQRSSPMQMAPAGMASFGQESMGLAGGSMPSGGAGPRMTTRPSNSTNPAPGGYNGQALARMSGGGFGGLGTGGLNAWGCWDSECCECRIWQCYYTGDGRCHWVCVQNECNPCERCIWPW